MNRGGRRRRARTGRLGDYCTSSTISQPTTAACSSSPRRRPPSLLTRRLFPFYYHFFALSTTSHSSEVTAWVGGITTLTLWKVDRPAPPLPPVLISSTTTCHFVSRDGRDGRVGSSEQEWNGRRITNQCTCTKNKTWVTVLSPPVPNEE